MKKMKKNAFTLIELMVVIIIIAILMSIAVMNFRGMIIRTNLQGANQTIADILQEVRTKALTKTKCSNGENALRWVYELDTGSNQITVKCEDDQTPTESSPESIRGCDAKVVCDLANDIDEIKLYNSGNDGANWNNTALTDNLTVTFFTDSYHAKIQNGTTSNDNIKIDSTKNGNTYSTCMDKHAAYPLTSTYKSTCKLFD